MKKILYKFEYFSTPYMSDGKMNEFGLMGWELVSVYNGTAYFKRQIG